MNEIPMLAYVIAELKSRRGYRRRVSEGTGVPMKTLRNIATGATKNPGLQTLHPIYEWLKEHEGECPCCDKRMP